MALDVFLMYLSALFWKAAMHLIQTDSTLFYLFPPPLNFKSLVNNQFQFFVCVTLDYTIISLALFHSKTRESKSQGIDLLKENNHPGFCCGLSCSVTVQLITHLHSKAACYINLHHRDSLINGLLGFSLFSALISEGLVRVGTAQHSSGL